jgi:inhibitor of KinA sporulation pathway (predicted exonuclease)
MSARKTLDKIIVVDLECTCWEDGEPLGERSEIIQIGVCSLVVETGEVINKVSYLTKPRHSTISPYCTELTGITPAMAKSAMPFDNACNRLVKEFGPKSRVWASFGIGDKTMFEAECHFKNALYPFSEHHIDVSTMFLLKHKIRGGGVSVTHALEKIGLLFVGKQHTADDDAYNTAILLAHILQ